MKYTFTKENYWNWIFMGAIVAPLFILLFSILRNDVTMRSPAIIFSVALIGGIAGRTIFSLNEYEKKNNSGRSGRIVRNIVVYLLMVLLGFVLLRVALF